MNPNYRIELADNINGSEKMTFNNNSSSLLDTVIKVIGVGNGGCNAVNRMIEEGLENVEFVAMNTDAQALSRSNAPTRIVLGDRITQGLGAGTDPEKGAEAAREDIARIEEIVSGANLVFIASSFGGGTGTGASPVVAEAAKKAGALTIGVVTKPFEYEGKLKMSRAESGIDKMLTVVDSLIIIPNENLYDMVDVDNYTYEQALSVVDDILRQGVQGISDIITQTGFINVDFADVKTMISLSNGRAHLGIGVGKGDDRLNKSITNAFENPLLDVSSIKNARGILANIVCPKDFGMKEYKEASKIINSYSNENANIKIGVCPKEDIKDEIIVTIVATGFDANAKNESNNENIDSNFNDRFDTNINNNSINKNNRLDNSINNNSIINKKEDAAISESKIEAIEINNKVIYENNIVSNNNTENIIEIDDINTILKEHAENPKKEIELNSSSLDYEYESINEINLKKDSENDIEEKINAEQSITAEENIISDKKSINNSFEDKIKNLKKPIIFKSNRAFNYNSSANNNDNEDNSLVDEKEFNKNILKRDINIIKEDSKNYEDITSSNLHIESDKISEISHSKYDEKHDNSYSNKQKIPFDIASEDFMEQHNKMGSNLYIFGETSSADNDLDKPAFLRRQIQARKRL